MSWDVAKVLTAYGEYMMPRVKNVRPRGFDRPSAQRTDVRFHAWIRVVTEPRYLEFEPDVRRFFTGEGVKTRAVEEFERILAVSLAWRPFQIRPGEEETQDISKAFIPVSAAAMCASVAVKTIHRWIDRGLKHQKRGAYYWVSVSDLEKFWEQKGKRTRSLKHLKRRVA